MTNPGFRQFWLENEEGERIGLNGEHEWILVNPTGLGYQSGVGYSNLKNGFFSPNTDDAPEQQSVVGDLIFHGSEPYLQYRFFADWVLKAKELYLLYCPKHTIYRRRASLAYLTKTEISRQGALAIPISITGLTPWYLPSESYFPIITVEDTEVNNFDGAPVFAETTDDDDNSFIHFDDGQAFVDIEMSSNGDAQIVIEPTGQLPGALQFSAQGPIEQIRVTIVGDITRITYGDFVIGESISSFETIEYSSEPGNCHIRKRNIFRDEITDLIDKMDLTQDIYPRLPITESYTITLNGVSSNASSVVITVH